MICSGCGTTQGPLFVDDMGAGVMFCDNCQATEEIPTVKANWAFLDFED